MCVYDRTPGFAAFLKGTLAALLFFASLTPCSAEEAVEKIYQVNATMGGVEVSLTVFGGVGIEFAEREIFVSGSPPDIDQANAALMEELQRHGGVPPVRGYGFRPSDLCKLTETPGCQYVRERSSVLLAGFRYTLVKPERAYTEIAVYPAFCGHNVKWLSIEGVSRSSPPSTYIMPGTMSILHLMVDEAILVRVTASNLYGGFAGAESIFVVKNAAELAACALSYTTKD